MPLLQEDHYWVQLAKSGDQQAFAKLVDRYWLPLHRWLYQLSGNGHEAEDIVQEAFLRAWSSLDQLQADVTFRVWLFRISRNCFLDRRRGPRGKTPEKLSEYHASGEEEPLGRLLEQEAGDRLALAIDQLPLHYRDAYLLWTQEDLPYNQIAQILEITEETARWRVCKARQLLLDLLSSYLDCDES